MLCTRGVSNKRKLRKKSEKTRGVNKCEEGAKLKHGEKVQIEFSHNHAIGDNYDTFVN